MEPPPQETLYVAERVAYNEEGDKYKQELQAREDRLLRQLKVQPPPPGAAEASSSVG